MSSNRFASVVEKLRNGFLSGKSKPLEFRLQQLNELKRFLVENETKIIDALKKDLHKCSFETRVLELVMVFDEIKHASENLASWMRPRSVPKPSPKLMWLFDSLMMYPEPYGVCLIISPWNYPVQLSLVALAGAISAGNCTVLKPSEVASNIEKVFAEELPKYLDPETFSVVCGDAHATGELLENQFDHIFYTGSTMVGKIVMAAAAKHLTPVTLELGGKSPTIIDSTTNLTTASNRIAWGKLINSGQSCIAPDYVFVESSVEDRFIEEYKQAVERMFGKNPRESDSFGRIINARHFGRLKNMLAHHTGEVVFGGEAVEDELYIAPTVIKNVSPSDHVMEEEIFGPILPVMTYTQIESVIDFINRRPKPLALYVFSENKSLINRVMDATSSGAFVANDVVVQAGANTLPFGGVGPSGIGGYHGKHSFDCFSHQKPVVLKNSGMEKGNQARYAPYTLEKEKRIMWLLGYPKSMDESNSRWKTYLLLSLAALLIGIYVKSKM